MVPSPSTRMHNKRESQLYKIASHSRFMYKPSSLPSTPFFSRVSDLFCASGKTGTSCVGFTMTGWNMFGCETVVGGAGPLFIC